jgi:hypothetical protein
MVTETTDSLVEQRLEGALVRQERPLRRPRLLTGVTESQRSKVAGNSRPNCRETSPGNDGFRAVR